MDLLKSIKELGAFELVGICRLHRHFDMKAGECVVSKIVDNQIRSSVKQYEANFVPWQWRYTEESGWIACEFFEAESLSLSSEQLIMLQKVFELVEGAIKQLGVESAFNQLGLTLNIKSLGNLSGKDGYVFNETTDEEKREQKTQLTAHSDIKDNVVITRWYIDHEDKCESTTCSESLWGACGHK